jgi:choline monooxygenase
MFLSDTHLPHILAPDMYCSAPQYQREVERLFLPGWHCVGQISEFPREGDYKTLELLGRPILLWRHDGEMHAFLNVCPHRHSMLTGAACGTMQPLRCQYHGWEFDQTGNTRRIPDARSFKPLQAGQLGLSKYPARTMGHLIFVSLAESPPDLEQALGPRRQLFSEWFPLDRTVVLKTDDLVDANWKIIMENAIEGYHVEMVHAKTFRKMAHESDCHHELGRTWTWYTEKMKLSPMDLRLHRWLRVDVDDQYKIYHCFPNLLIGKMALFHWVFTVLPVSPMRSRLVTYMYCQAGRPGRPHQAALTRLIVGWGRRFFRRVMNEDLSIMTSLQRGLASPEHASGGLISMREERLFQFQRYIQETTQSGQGAQATMPRDVPVDHPH